MDLEAEVKIVMQSAGRALTVDQVSQAICENIKGEVRSILNALVDAGRLSSVHGGGGYQTHYKANSIERRT